MKRILVIGASGYLGRIIGSIGTDHVIVGTSRRPTAGLVSLDPAKPNDVQRCIETFAADVVVNLAGVASGAPPDLERAHVRVVKSLIDGCSTARTRLVTLGTAAECGARRTPEPITESVECHPLSMYGVTKLRATLLIKDAAALGADVSVARLFNVIGAHMPLAQPVAEFDQAIRGGSIDPVTVKVRSGSTVRDFVPAKFAASAILALATSSIALPPVVNICSGKPTTFTELIRAIAHLHGRSLDLVDLDESLAVPFSVGSPTLLKELTGLAHTDGIDRTVEALCP